ncbi:MAG: phosphotransferase [Chloroflexi bacterium]|nr:phosphotransferase [Chloroflexota bacterium]
MAVIAVALAACGGAATSVPQPTQPVAAAASPAPTVVTRPTATAAPAPAPTLQVPTAQPPTPVPEERVIELEWPPRMKLGESDLIRLSLIHSKNGYTVTTEFPDHTTITHTVPVPRPGGFDLSAVARLEAVGFEFAPQGEQSQGLPLDEPVTFRWTLTPGSAGQHRLSVDVKLRWTPQAGNAGPAHETQIYSKGLTVQITSFFGLTARQAAAMGVVGLAFGVTLSLPLTAYALRPRRPSLRLQQPNPSLVIERHPSFNLTPADTALLRALFSRYARLTLEAEFHSGYSGARTFLALPVRADGRADAYTIAKIGERDSIRREFENYETFVKDTLPPITARIQETPVETPRGGGLAALRYTFIGEPGRTPASLREALIANPDLALLDKLFETFGPNWWMQRKPYTFRLAQEYDRMLPAHFVLEPVTGKSARTLDGRAAPSEARLQVGDEVTVRNFRFVEHRPDGRSLALTGVAVPGHPPVRVRWQSTAPFDNATARVVATRDTLLRNLAAGFDRYGLPDPLALWPRLLDERIIGSQSTIHGDLNLENVLVGLGGFVWLIDFAQTRDGHPLFDFAHLEAQIIAHVIAPRLSDPAQFAPLWRSGADPLLAAMHAIAARCLFNASQPREYHLALFMACLGALKYSNLPPFARHSLYLTAASLAQNL